MNNNFKVSGMHCNACQKIIEGRLSKITGVSNVKADLSGEVIITANRTVSLDEVKLALDKTGYQIN